MRETKRGCKVHISQSRILPGLIIFFGLLLCIYPWISNFFYEKSVGSQIESYQQQSMDLAEKKKIELLLQAEKYNQELASSKVKLTDPFSGRKWETGLNYNRMLSFNNSGIMGTVNIPCIDVNLPIYHGTDHNILEKGIGHLFGTSLPIGGKSTHSVLTGHTGLSSAKMFTDLTQVKEGDLFYLSVLSKTLVYRVDQISVVKPEDTKKLQIINGKDYVTLVTCTPYGINNRRLLIRGSRTKYVNQDQIKNRTLNSQWMQTYQKAIFIGILIIAVFFVVGKIAKKIRTKKGEKFQ